MSANDLKSSSRVKTATPRRYERHKSANVTTRKSQDPLMTCIELNYKEELETILRSNGKYYTQEKLDQLFLRAAIAGNSDACNILVNYGSDPNVYESPADHKKRHNGGNNPFILEHGKRESWMKYHSSIGGSALHLAVEYDHMKTVQILIHLGTNLNGRDRNGVTPLMLACMKRGSSNIVHFLTLIPGCEIRAKDNVAQKTALHYAAEAGDAAVVKLLLEAGAHVDEKDGVQNTPLMSALTQSTYENPKWQPRQTVKCVQLLIENGSFVNTYNADDKSPIYFAVVSRIPEVVQELLQKSALVSEDVLRIACLQIRDQTIVELLLNEAHTFDDELLCSLLLVVIASISSKWAFNARDEECNSHNIAKAIIKSISDPSVYTTIRTLTDQQLEKYLNGEFMNSLSGRDITELRAYGIFGYALMQGKFSIARMLYEAGCRDKLSRLKGKTEFISNANKHPYLKTWLPDILKNCHQHDQDSSDDEENICIFGLDLDKAFDNVEPYDDTIHESGHGMMDVNYTSRENSRAYLATNVLIYSN